MLAHYLKVNAENALNTNTAPTPEHTGRYNVTQIIKNYPLCPERNYHPTLRYKWTQAKLKQFASNVNH